GDLTWIAAGDVARLAVANLFDRPPELADRPQRDAGDDEAQQRQHGADRTQDLQGLAAESVDEAQYLIEAAGHRDVVSLAGDRNLALDHADMDAKLVGHRRGPVFVDVEGRGNGRQHAAGQRGGKIDDLAGRVGDRPVPAGSAAGKARIGNIDLVARGIARIDDVADQRLGVEVEGLRQAGVEGVRVELGQQEGGGDERDHQPARG